MPNKEPNVWPKKLIPESVSHSPALMSRALGFNDAINLCRQHVEGAIPTIDEIAFQYFKSVMGYEEEQAKTEWTGMHYKRLEKQDSTGFATAIHAMMREKILGEK